MKKIMGNDLLGNGSTEIEPYYRNEYEALPGGYALDPEPEEDQKQIIWKFIGSIRKHWFMIIFVNVLVTSLAVVYVAQKRDFYEASTRIQVNNENNPAAGITANGGSIVINQTNDPAYFSTQLQILEGEGLLRRVVQNLDLKNNPLFMNPDGEQKPTAFQNVAKMFGFWTPPPPVVDESANNVVTKSELKLNRTEEEDSLKNAESLMPLVSRVSSGLTVNPVFDKRTQSSATRLIEVSFTHGNPEIAAKVVNEIGSVYVIQNLENKIKSNTAAGDFLEKRVAELQSLIRSGEERLINYSKQNQIVSLDAGQNTVVQRFSDLNLQLGQAENARINAQTSYQAALQNSMRETAIQSQDGQVVALEAKLADLRQQLAQLKTEFTDEWYQVVQVKRQIETIENQLLPLRKRASEIQMASLKEKLNEAIARETVLRENFNRQRGEVMRQNEASINYRIIEQEINTNKTLLDDLLQRTKENNLILNRTPNNVQVVDQALPPKSAVGPRRMKDVAIAFFASLFVGIGLAFAIDWFNDSVQHAEDVEQLFGLPVLAAIPTAPMHLSRKLLPSRLRSKRGNTKKNYNLKAFDRTEFQEAYLQLSTQIVLSSPGGEPRSILVTSAEEGEGKTLTALNLAKSLAESGKKTLLIDADLRCPKVHRLIDQDNYSGLTTLLSVKDLTEELIADVIKQNAIGELDVLTSGERTMNPGGLLNSAEMELFMHKLLRTYAHIIIDSPPVLYFADSLILSVHCSGVLVVVRDNYSSRHSILQVKKKLASVGARIIGMVMNGVPLQWNAYYKYRDYETGEPAPDFEADAPILKLN
ncbi:MAG: polysaccharide biosynthesis tyrosine autokinase [Pyrinomonadaceae bacterium]|nr:polysaccharide biosynthesis tyrosine autokinase [Pyrinomonadaceae bacterium]